MPPSMNSEERRPLLILLKGHPCSGKSTLAQKLASMLPCSLIDKDDAKSVLASELGNTIDRDKINDLSYKIIQRGVETHLLAGIDCLVDCPLARRTLFDDFYNLALKHHSLVALIECVAVDVDVWRRRVEERGRLLSNTADEHKAFNWEELQRLIRQYGDCWKWSEEVASGSVVDYYKTLDTTSGIRHQELVEELRTVTGKRT